MSGGDGAEVQVREEKDWHFNILRGLLGRMYEGRRGAGDKRIGVDEWGELRSARW